MNSDFNFYKALLIKRLPAMAVIFLICAGIGAWSAVTAPARYVADAKLLVESARISNELLRNNNGGSASEEQLQVIEQQLMTRAHLIDIANKYRVYQDGARMTPDEVVLAMREQTTIAMQFGRDRPTLMTISFRSSNPKTAADVVNEMVTLVLKADAEMRRGGAEQQLEFFEQEVQRLDDELTKKSAAIVAFQEANKEALPDGLEFRMDRQAQLQERMNLSARDRASLISERDRLLAVGTSAGAAPGVQLTPEQQRLVSLKADLSKALVTYSEQHPLVKRLKAEIDQVRAEVEGQAEAANSGRADQPASTGNSVLDLQLAQIDSRVKFIDDEVSRTVAELEQLRIAIEKTPENAIHLAALQRDYENTQSLYNQKVAALNAAKTTERIEVLSKGERVTIVEQATVPTEPNSPNRKLIAGGGVVAGSALAVVFFVLTELLNRSIRRPVDLVRGLGIQPLATIPYLEEETTRRRRRLLKSVLVVGVLVLVPIALWAVHTFYWPLDLLVAKAMDRLGL